MVRVVSGHHFVSQDVFLSDNEPAAFCSAQGKFLIATTEHIVNIHNLDSRGNILHSFPTVDFVKQIIFCESGNYVATIESKASWHRSLVTYVRIYFKWWIEINGQPLKVRIAGCASPDVNQSWGNQFEMVELPLDETALYITSCVKTSALAVSLGKVISLFCYCTKIHEASKQRFHDFIHFANINLYFIVKEISMCENYIACMSDKIVQVLKIVKECNEASKPQINYKEIEVNSVLEKTDVDSNMFDEDFIEWRFESCMNDGTNDVEWENHIKSKLHEKSFPITIHLQAIDKENENFSDDEECELFGPLLNIKGCSINMTLDMKVYEMFPSLSFNMNVVTQLYRQFKPNENHMLTGLQLVPFYQAEPIQEGIGDPLHAVALSSEKCSYILPWPNASTGSSSFKAIGCFFSTNTEGFLYDITCKVQLISTYKYTALLKAVVLEPTLLHALTQTGLETYTVHLPHLVFTYIEDVDHVKNEIPNFEDPICLLGLRPFLGVDHLVMAENHVVLVSSMEDSVTNNTTTIANTSTLYSLKKPMPKQIYSDLLEVAEGHKTSSPSTYCHLLSEGHMILRTELFFNKSQDPEIEMLFKKSSLLLADYYICSEPSEKIKSVPYYHMSGISPENVVQRVMEFRRQAKNGNVLKGLIPYLNTILFDEISATKFSPSQAVADMVLTAYSEESPELLWKLVLCSNLNGYKIDKAILTLKRRLTSKRHPLSPISNAADTTALVSLLLQKGNNEAAQNVFLSLSKADLVNALINIHHIIWDNGNLSILGKFIKLVRPDAFIELLLQTVDNNKIQISQILHILQNESPNSDLHCVPLLKEFLEASLSDKKILSAVDPSILNLLVKIYLKRLLELNEKSSSASSTFVGSVCSFTLLFGSRPTWLNEMLPFNGKGISRTCIFSSKNGDITTENQNNLCCCWTCNEDLLRLQSLLSYLGPSDEIKELVLECLQSSKEKNPSWISLEVMCSYDAQAVKMLIEMAPKALLPYSKENFKNDEKKWCMLFSLLYEHMKNLPDDAKNFEIYSETFHGVLTHLAETLKPVELLGLLPQGENPTFLPHVKRCVEKHQADQLKNKIVSLGQEIKSMM